MSMTINGATNTLTAASGLTVAGNTAVTGTLSATGGITGQAACAIAKDGSDTVGGGSYFQLSNAAGSRSQIIQLGASNDLAFWNYNGATWRKALTIANSTGALTYQPDGSTTVLAASGTGLAVTGTLSASGITSVTDVTDATSTTAASLKTAGGLAVAKKLHVGTLVDLSAAAAGQIKFPATPNASSDYNTLDDYQEHQLNSFVPTLTFGGGSTGMTFGSYRTLATKIGPLVTFWIQIALSAKGSSTGAAVVGGLPYTSWNDGATNPIVNFGASVLTYSGNIFGLVVNNSATVALYNHASGGAQTALTDAAFADTTIITISGSYWINH
jgi:hypothetical protein